MARTVAVGNHRAARATLGKGRGCPSITLRLFLHEQLRRVVGTDVVSTVEDLFNEANMLMDIWREYRADTVAQGLSDLISQASVIRLYPESTKRRLPEPPALRERLRQEIAFFVANIQQFQGQAAVYVRYASAVLYCTLVAHDGWSVVTSDVM